MNQLDNFQLSPLSKKDFIRRQRIILSFIFVAFLLIILRLYLIQVVKGGDYREKSVNNSERLIREPGIRGRILDYNEKLLADNRNYFSLYISPKIKGKDVEGSTEDAIGTIQKVGQMLSWDEAEVSKLADRLREKPRKKLLLSDDLSLVELTPIFEKSVNLPGVTIESSSERFYLKGKPLAHLVGYMNEITTEELLGTYQFGYKSGDKVGRSGIESVYERQLRGEDGGRQVEVNNRGLVRSVLAEMPSHKGNNVILNIDSDLQFKAFDALRNEETGADYEGVIIVMDPRDGAVRAMVSKPSYPPNMFNNLSPDEYEKVINDPDTDFQNKAIQNYYPPGSLFKLVTALAAVDSGVVTPDLTVYCSGSFQHGNSTFRCWNRYGHGTVDFIQATALSCNIYYYNLALETGVRSMYQIASQLGMDDKTGIDLPGEQNYPLPTPGWKELNFGEPWFDGDTINMGIGQGFVQITPLQMLNAYCTVANGGKLMRPRVMNRIVDADGNIVSENPPEVIGRLRVDRDTLDLVREGLEAVIRNTKGGDHSTGKKCQIDGVRVAGKSGTSENPEGPDKEDHAWFVAFAPVEEPVAAVLVLVEEGGFGGTIAGPIARKVLVEALAKYAPADRISRGEIDGHSSSDRESM